MAEIERIMSGGVISPDSVSSGKLRAAMLGAKAQGGTVTKAAIEAALGYTPADTNNVPIELTDAEVDEILDEIVGRPEESLVEVLDSIQAQLGGGSVVINTPLAERSNSEWLKVYQRMEVERVSSEAYYSVKPIDISNLAIGSNAIVHAAVNGRRGVFILDENMRILDYISGDNAAEHGITESSAQQRIEMTVPDNAKYIVFSVRTYYYTDMHDFDVAGTVYGNVDMLSHKVDDALRNKVVNKTESIGKNLFDPTTADHAVINDATGKLAATESYYTSTFIPVSAGTKVSISKIRKFLAFDANYNPIASSYVDGVYEPYTYTATQDGYVRVSLFANNLLNQIEYGDPTDCEPYKAELSVEDAVHLSKAMRSDTMDIADGNVLSGKKWVACGDSFTQGAYSDSPTNDYTFIDPPYMGKLKTYPYFIGRRNKRMTVINEAIGGSTMTAGSKGQNPFSVNRYKNIPADADIITLRFGINDAGYGCPIGTINDTTNETFYGAWNVVLDYLTTHFPFAKIGIIVGCGMQTEAGNACADAEIAVAKKWGIPYLNTQYESGNGIIPLMFRTSNPNVSQVAKDKAFEKMVVNRDTNWHPNAHAHEFESTFIEAWLRTL